jgi:DNA-binding transcriptional ArsR family regulator
VKSARKPSGALLSDIPKPHGSESASLDRVFSALSSPTRRAILAKLSKGESTVTDLARPFDISLPAISKHIRILQQAHVITVARDGRTHRCRLAPVPLTNAERWIAFYRRMWEGQLDSLAEFLKASKGAGV